MKNFKNVFDNFPSNERLNKKDNNHKKSVVVTIAEKINFLGFSEVIKITPN